MAKKPTIIEINGRKYDADSGQMISSGSVSHNVELSVQGQVIDGFAAPHRTRTKQPAKNIHRTTQKSKKLHPAIAQKAAPKKIEKEKKLKSASEFASLTASARHELSRRISNDRQERAKLSAKSEKVDKFGKAAPRMAPVSSQQPTAPAPIKQARRETDTVEPEKKPSRVVRLLRARPRLLPTAAGVGVTLLLVGYVTYLNLPNMALRVAASRAGFEASLPGYKPTGFKLDGPITYAPGQIALNFGTSGDERNFQLIQRESTWDSQSLLDNYVVRENKRYITFQEQGLTIYVYDDSNATWVDGGIWYTIEGESLLSSEQLLKIAASL